MNTMKKLAAAVITFVIVLTTVGTMSVFADSRIPEGDMHMVTRVEVGIEEGTRYQITVAVGEDLITYTFIGGDRWKDFFGNELSSANLKNIGKVVLVDEKYVLCSDYGYVKPGDLMCAEFNYWVEYIG